MCLKKRGLQKKSLKLESFMEDAMSKGFDKLDPRSHVI
jgi:hypothetical protein